MDFRAFDGAGLDAVTRMSSASTRLLLDFDNIAAETRRCRTRPFTPWAHILPDA